MKTFNLIAAISGIIAVICILGGFIFLLFDFKLFGVKHAVNYFHVANSMLLLTVCSLLYILVKEVRENKK